ncbi:MAG: hypothetical protein QXH07_05440, partial [Thermoplasmata archaeon]
MNQNNSKIKGFYAFLIYFIVLDIVIAVYYYAKHTFLFPPDDFTKDLMWTNYFSYGKMYPDSFFATIVKFNPWFGYDVTLGFIRNLIGKYNALFFIPIAFGIAGFFAMIFSVFSLKIDKNYNYSYFTLTVIVLAYSLWGVLINSRPEIFCTLLFIIALNQRSKIYSILWILISAFMYSLFWLYAGMFVIFLLIKKEYKLSVISLIAIAAGLTFWFGYAGFNAYWHYVWMLFNIQKYRDGMSIAENTNGFYLFFVSIGFAILLFVFFAFLKKDYKKLKTKYV